MQRKPVVRSLLTTAGWFCLAACGSADGNLFEGEVTPPLTPTPSLQAPSQEPPSPEAPAPQAPSLEAPVEGVAETPVVVVMQSPASPAETANGELPLTPVMSAPPAAPPPPPEEMSPAGPRIVSVSPADGARGVSNDVRIVITFSVPMDQARTEAAYQSEGVPSSAVSFSWNEEGTVLTITPDDLLDYPSGTDPEAVEVRPINYFLSTSARDLNGQQLAAPEEFSFALLRQINVSLAAQRNRDLTGSWRSNDTYGVGDCARDQTTVCIGDSGTGGIQYKGFMSFDLGPLPTNMAQLNSARLSFQITQRSGNPFNGLGAFFLDHVAFDVIGRQAFAANPLAGLGTIAANGNTGTTLQMDVRAALRADLGQRARAQFRLAFEEITNNSGVADTIISSWNSQRIDASYLIP